MTDVLKTAREELTPLAEIRSVQEELRSTAGEYDRYASEVQVLGRSLEERSVQIRSLRDQLAGLKESDGFREDQERARELDGAEESIAALERDYRDAALTIARVLERAGKNAARAGATRSEKVLHEAVLVLRRTAVPSEEELERALAPAMESIPSLMAEGKVPLKSKEERELFARGQDPRTRVMESAAHYRKASGNLDVLRTAVTTSPVLARVHALEEGIRKEDQLTREDERRRSAAADGIARLEEQRQALMQRLEERVSAAMNRKVRVVWDS
jgi:hypothetical protein